MGKREGQKRGDGGITGAEGGVRKVMNGENRDGRGEQEGI